MQPDSFSCVPTDVNQTDYRPVDKIVGIILAVLSLCGVLCGGLIAAGSGMLGAFGISQARQAGAQDTAPIAFISGAGLLVGLSIATLYLLNVAGAIGVMKSARWGFILTAIMSGLAALASLGGQTLWLDSLPNLAACVYCILRLNGTLGPKPD